MKGVVDWIAGRVIRVQVVLHVLVLVGCLDMVYQRVGIGVGQFCTRSVLAQNLLVMAFIHSYVLKFQNTEAQIDRSIDEYFLFLFSTRYKISCDDTPVECGGFSYELLCASRISYQFEVHSFT